MLRQVIALATEEFGYTAASVRHQFLGNKQLLRKVLVNGSPKTGTTWVLNMMISMPGYRPAAYADTYNFDGNIELYHQDFNW